MAPILRKIIRDAYRRECEVNNVDPSLNFLRWVEHTQTFTDFSIVIDSGNKSNSRSRSPSPSAATAANITTTATRKSVHSDAAATVTPTTAAAAREKINGGVSPLNAAAFSQKQRQQQPLLPAVATQAAQSSQYFGRSAKRFVSSVSDPTIQRKVNAILAALKVTIPPTAMTSFGFQHGLLMPAVVGSIINFLEEVCEKQSRQKVGEEEKEEGASDGRDDDKNPDDADEKNQLTFFKSVMKASHMSGDKNDYEGDDDADDDQNHPTRSSSSSFLRRIDLSGNKLTIFEFQRLCQLAMQFQHIEEVLLDESNFYPRDVLVEICEKNRKLNLEERIKAEEESRVALAEKQRLRNINNIIQNTNNNNVVVAPPLPFSRTRSGQPNFFHQSKQFSVDGGEEMSSGGAHATAEGRNNQQLDNNIIINDAFGTSRRRRVNPQAWVSDAEYRAFQRISFPIEPTFKAIQTAISIGSATSTGMSGLFFQFVIADIVLTLKRIAADDVAIENAEVAKRLLDENRKNLPPNRRFSLPPPAPTSSGGVQSSTSASSPPAAIINPPPRSFFEEIAASLPSRKLGATDLSTILQQSFRRFNFWRQEDPQSEALFFKPIPNTRATTPCCVCGTFCGDVINEGDEGEKNNNSSGGGDVSSTSPPPLFDTEDSGGAPLLLSAGNGPQQQSNLSSSAGNDNQSDGFSSDPSYVSAAAAAAGNNASTPAATMASVHGNSAILTLAQAIFSVPFHSSYDPAQSTMTTASSGRADSTGINDVRATIAATSSLASNSNSHHDGVADGNVGLAPSSSAIPLSSQQQHQQQRFTYKPLVWLYEYVLGIVRGCTEAFLLNDEDEATLLEAMAKYKNSMMATATATKKTTAMNSNGNTDNKNLVTASSSSSSPTVISMPFGDCVLEPPRVRSKACAETFATVLTCAANRMGNGVLPSSINYHNHNSVNSNDGSSKGNGGNRSSSPSSSAPTCRYAIACVPLPNVVDVMEECDMLTNTTTATASCSSSAAAHTSYIDQGSKMIISNSNNQQQSSSTATASLSHYKEFDEIFQQYQNQNQREDEKKIASPSSPSTVASAVTTHSSHSSLAWYSHKPLLLPTTPTDKIEIEKKMKKGKGSIINSPSNGIAPPPPPPPHYNDVVLQALATCAAEAENGMNTKEEEEEGRQQLLHQSSSISSSSTSASTASSSATAASLLSLNPPNKPFVLRRFRTAVESVSTTTAGGNTRDSHDNNVINANKSESNSIFPRDYQGISLLAACQRSVLAIPEYSSWYDVLQRSNDPTAPSSFDLIAYYLAHIRTQSGVVSGSSIAFGVEMPINFMEDDNDDISEREEKNSPTGSGVGGEVNKKSNSTKTLSPREMPPYILPYTSSSNTNRNTDSKRFTTVIILQHVCRYKGALMVCGVAPNGRFVLLSREVLNGFATRYDAVAFITIESCETQVNVASRHKQKIRRAQLLSDKTILPTGVTKSKTLAEGGSGVEGHAYSSSPLIRSATAMSPPSAAYIDALIEAITLPALLRSVKSVPSSLIENTFEAETLIRVLVSLMTTKRPRNGGDNESQKKTKTIALGGENSDNATTNDKTSSASSSFFNKYRFTPSAETAHLVDRLLLSHRLLEPACKREALKLGEPYVPCLSDEELASLKRLRHAFTVGDDGRGDGDTCNDEDEKCDDDNRTAAEEAEHSSNSTPTDIRAAFPSLLDDKLLEVTTNVLTSIFCKERPEAFVWNRFALPTQTVDYLLSFLTLWEESRCDGSGGGGGANDNAAATSPSTSPPSASPTNNNNKTPTSPPTASSMAKRMMDTYDLMIEKRFPFKRTAFVKKNAEGDVLYDYAVVASDCGGGEEKAQKQHISTLAVPPIQLLRDGLEAYRLGSIASIVAWSRRVEKVASPLFLAAFVAAIKRLHGHLTPIIHHTVHPSLRSTTVSSTKTASKGTVAAGEKKGAVAYSPKQQPPPPPRRSRYIHLAEASVSTSGLFESFENPDCLLAMDDGDEGKEQYNTSANAGDNGTSAKKCRRPPLRIFSDDDYASPFITIDAGFDFSIARITVDLSFGGLAVAPPPPPKPTATTTTLTQNDNATPPPPTTQSTPPPQQQTAIAITPFDANGPPINVVLHGNVNNAPNTNNGSGQHAPPAWVTGSGGGVGNGGTASHPASHPPPPPPLGVAAITATSPSASPQLLAVAATALSPTRATMGHSGRSPRRGGGGGGVVESHTATATVEGLLGASVNNGNTLAAPRPTSRMRAGSFTRTKPPATPVQTCPVSLAAASPQNISAALGTANPQVDVVTAEENGDKEGKNDSNEVGGAAAGTTADNIAAGRVLTKSTNGLPIKFNGVPTIIVEVSHDGRRYREIQAVPIASGATADTVVQQSLSLPFKGAFRYWKLVWENVPKPTTDHFGKDIFDHCPHIYKIQLAAHTESYIDCCCGSVGKKGPLVKGALFSDSRGHTAGAMFAFPLLERGIHTNGQLTHRQRYLVCSAKESYCDDATKSDSLSSASSSASSLAVPLIGRIVDDSFDAYQYLAAFGKPLNKYASPKQREQRERIHLLEPQSGYWSVLGRLGHSPTAAITTPNAKTVFLISCVNEKQYVSRCSKTSGCVIDPPTVIEKHFMFASLPSPFREIIDGSYAMSETIVLIYSGFVFTLFDLSLRRVVIPTQMWYSNLPGRPMIEKNGFGNHKEIPPAKSLFCFPLRTVQIILPDFSSVSDVLMCSGTDAVRWRFPQNVEDIIMYFNSPFSRLSVENPRLPIPECVLASEAAPYLISTTNVKDLVGTVISHSLHDFKAITDLCVAFSTESGTVTATTVGNHHSNPQHPNSSSQNGEETYKFISGADLATLNSFANVNSHDKPIICSPSPYSSSSQNSEQSPRSLALSTTTPPPPPHETLSPSSAALTATKGNKQQHRQSQLEGVANFSQFAAVFESHCEIIFKISELSALSAIVIVGTCSGAPLIVEALPAPTEWPPKRFAAAASSSKQLSIRHGSGDGGGSDKSNGLNASHSGNGGGDHHDNVSVVASTGGGGGGGGRGGGVSNSKASGGAHGDWTIISRAEQNAVVTAIPIPSTVFPASLFRIRTELPTSSLSIHRILLAQRRDIQTLLALDGKHSSSSNDKVADKNDKNLSTKSGAEEQSKKEIENSVGKGRQRPNRHHDGPSPIALAPFTHCPSAGPSAAVHIIQNKARIVLTAASMVGGGDDYTMARGIRIHLARALTVNERQLLMSAIEASSSSEFGSVTTRQQPPVSFSANTVLVGNGGSGVFASNPTTAMMTPPPPPPFSVSSSRDAAIFSPVNITVTQLEGSAHPSIDLLFEKPLVARVIALVVSPAIGTHSSVGRLFQGCVALMASYNVITPSCKPLQPAAVSASASMSSSANGGGAVATEHQNNNETNHSRQLVGGKTYAVDLPAGYQTSLVRIVGTILFETPIAPSSTNNNNGDDVKSAEKNTTAIGGGTLSVPAPLTTAIDRHHQNYHSGGNTSGGRGGSNLSRQQQQQQLQNCEISILRGERIIGDDPTTVSLSEVIATTCVKCNQQHQQQQYSGFASSVSAGGAYNRSIGRSNLIASPPPTAETNTNTNNTPPSPSSSSVLTSPVLFATSREEVDIIIPSYALGSNGTARLLIKLSHPNASLDAPLSLWYPRYPTPISIHQTENANESRKNDESCQTIDEVSSPEKSVVFRRKALIAVNHNFISQLCPIGLRISALNNATTMGAVFPTNSTRRCLRVFGYAVTEAMGTWFVSGASYTKTLLWEGKDLATHGQSDSDDHSILFDADGHRQAYDSGAAAAASSSAADDGAYSAEASTTAMYDYIEIEFEYSLPTADPLLLQSTTTSTASAEAAFQQFVDNHLVLLVNPCHDGSSLDRAHVLSGDQMTQTLSASVHFGGREAQVPRAGDPIFMSLQVGARICFTSHHISQPLLFSGVSVEVLGSNNLSRNKKNKFVTMMKSHALNPTIAGREEGDDVVGEMTQQKDIDAGLDWDNDVDHLTFAVESVSPTGFDYTVVGYVRSDAKQPLVWVGDGSRNGVPPAQWRLVLCSHSREGTSNRKSSVNIAVRFYSCPLRPHTAPFLLTPHNAAFSSNVIAKHVLSEDRIQLLSQIHSHEDPLFAMNGAANNGGVGEDHHVLDLLAVEGVVEIRKSGASVLGGNNSIRNSIKGYGHSVKGNNQDPEMRSVAGGSPSTTVLYVGAQIKGEPQAFTKVSIHTLTDANHEFAIQYSDDGNNYTTVAIHPQREGWCTTRWRFCGFHNFWRIAASLLPGSVAVKRTRKSNASSASFHQDNDDRILGALMQNVNPSALTNIRWFVALPPAVEDTPDPAYIYSQLIGYAQCQNRLLIPQHDTTLFLTFPIGFGTPRRQAAVEPKRVIYADTANGSNKVGGGVLASSINNVATKTSTSTAAPTSSTINVAQTLALEEEAKVQQAMMRVVHGKVSSLALRSATQLEERLDESVPRIEDVFAALDKSEADRLRNVMAITSSASLSKSGGGGQNNNNGISNTTHQKLSLEGAQLFSGIAPESGMPFVTTTGIIFSNAFSGKARRASVRFQFTCPSMSTCNNPRVVPQMLVILEVNNTIDPTNALAMSSYTANNNNNDAFAASNNQANNNRAIFKQSYLETALRSHIIDTILKPIIAPPVSANSSNAHGNTNAANNSSSNNRHPHGNRHSSNNPVVASPTGLMTLRHSNANQNTRDGSVGARTPLAQSFGVDNSRSNKTDENAEDDLTATNGSDESPQSTLIASSIADAILNLFDWAVGFPIPVNHQSTVASRKLSRLELARSFARKSPLLCLSSFDTAFGCAAGPFHTPNNEIINPSFEVPIRTGSSIVIICKTYAELLRFLRQDVPDSIEKQEEQIVMDPFERAEQHLAEEKERERRRRSLKNKAAAKNGAEPELDEDEDYNSLESPDFTTSIPQDLKASKTLPRCSEILRIISSISSPNVLSPTEIPVVVNSDASQDSPTVTVTFSLPGKQLCEGTLHLRPCRFTIVYYIEKGTVSIVADTAIVLPRISSTTTLAARFATSINKNNLTFPRLLHGGVQSVSDVERGISPDHPAVMCGHITIDTITQRPTRIGVYSQMLGSVASLVPFGSTWASHAFVPALNPSDVGIEHGMLAKDLQLLNVSTWKVLQPDPTCVTRTGGGGDRRTGSFRKINSISSSSAAMTINSLAASAAASAAAAAAAAITDVTSGSFSAGSNEADDKNLSASGLCWWGGSIHHCSLNVDAEATVLTFSGDKRAKLTSSQGVSGSDCLTTISNTTKKGWEMSAKSNDESITIRGDNTERKRKLVVSFNDNTQIIPAGSASLPSPSNATESFEIALECRSVTVGLSGMSVGNVDHCEWVTEWSVPSSSPSTIQAALETYFKKKQKVMLLTESYADCAGHEDDGNASKASKIEMETSAFSVLKIAIATVSVDGFDEPMMQIGGSVNDKVFTLYIDLQLPTISQIVDQLQIMYPRIFI